MQRPFKIEMPEPCLLDREADALLQQGFVAQAERLAREAERLREAGR